MLKEETLQKLKRYCAYQERCHQEVRTKLLSMKIYGQLLEEIMSELINEDYLNEERFARSYTRGKYKLKKWGRNRIEQELKLRKISAYCRKKAFEEIDEKDYLNNLKAIIEKYKREREHQISEDELNRKAFNHAMTKGYEYNLIKKIMEENG